MASTEKVSPTDQTYSLQGGLLRRTFGLFGRSMKRHPKLFTISISASVLHGIAVVASGEALGWATDAVIIPAVNDGDFDTKRIWQAGLVLLLVGIVTTISIAVRRIVSGATNFHVQADHRREVTSQYTRLTLGWHRKHPTGQLLSNASSDAEAAASVFNPLPFAIGVISMLLIASGAMINADPVLGLIAAIILPLVMVANAVFRRYMSPAVTQVQIERAKVSTVAHESFHAATIVKSMGTVDRETTRFAKATEVMKDANIRAGRIRAIFDPVIDFLPTLTTLMVLAVGAHRVNVGLTAPGDLIQIAYLLSVMTFPIRAIGFVLGELPRSLAGHDRIGRVVDSREYLSWGDLDSSHLTTREQHGIEVELDDVAVTLGEGEFKATIVQEISHRIPAGSTLAIVGATGSGKSTLTDALVRLIDTSQGVIRYSGIPVNDLSQSARSELVAYVPQQVFIFEDTVRANVALSSEGTPDDAEIWRALKLAHAHDFVADLPDGLDTILGESGANLSGGQRQRIAIARALYQRPSLLVLDDATSAVDALIEREILLGLREQQATVVVVAYRPASIALADEVVHLSQGTIVSKGTHSQLLEQDPLYAHVVSTYARDRAAQEVEDQEKAKSTKQAAQGGVSK